MTDPPTSRLAPSPTGALHLGNARTFLINWALARQRSWRLVMRIEDLDGPRVKPEASRQALAILRWLGLDWDGAVLYQAADLEPYLRAMRRLAAQGVVYACHRTRTEIEAHAAGSAPHDAPGETRFPPDLRPSSPEAFTFENRETNYRLLVPERTITIHDRFAGPSEHCPANEVGDFVIWTKRGVPAYQLAVVVDDLRQGVTDVVRGDDLLPSAARQALLYEALDHAETPGPRWWHLPLVRGEDGRRLAKRHGDTRLITYKNHGVPAERIIGLLAWWSGVGDDRTPMTADAFVNLFDLAYVPRRDVTFTQNDHDWLMRES